MSGKTKFKESLRLGLPFDINDLCEKGLPNYKNYADRVKKSLYYGAIPSTDRPSKALTELIVDKFGSLCNQNGLDQLNLYDASSISYDACVTPCSVIVALLYLDRLRVHNPDYLAKTSSSQVFVVSLMVASKFLYDDGEEDEVYNDEWAHSAAMILSDLNQAEMEFLCAIDWNLYVDVAKFVRGLIYVETEVAQKEALSRGFFTYADLEILSRILPPVWTSLMSIIGSALVVCTVGYSFTLTIVTAGAVMGTHLDASLMTPFVPPVDTNKTECLGIQTCSSSTVEQLTNFQLNQDDDDQSNLDPKSPELKRTNRFHALRTLTAALLLTSSSTTKLADSYMRSTFFSVPNQSLLSQSWTSLEPPTPDFTDYRPPPCSSPPITFASSSGQRESLRNTPTDMAPNRFLKRTLPRHLDRKRNGIVSPRTRNQQTRTDQNAFVQQFPAPEAVVVDASLDDNSDLRVPPLHQHFEYDNFNYNQSLGENCSQGNPSTRYSCSKSTPNRIDLLQSFWHSVSNLRFHKGLGRILDIGWLKGGIFIST